MTADNRKFTSNANYYILEIYDIQQSTFTISFSYLQHIPRNKQISFT